MSWAATAVAAGSAISYYGNEQAAGAASGAANARAGMAGQMRQDIMGQAGKNERDVMNLAEASPTELAALGRSYDAAGKQLEREQRLMDAMDPAIMEASKQALGLLRGETAQSNNGLMQARNQQRQMLVNQLRGQYGSGAENSSVGQKALSQFDMQSNSMFQQNQQGSLSQLFGMANNANNGLGLQRSITGLQSVGQGYSDLQNRKLNARMNVGGQTLNALAGTSGMMVDSAGSQYAGDALRGAGLSAMGGNIAKIGGMGLAGKAAAPAAGSGNSYDFYGSFGSGITENGSGGGFGANRQIGQQMVE